jgi:hypothetical protein
MRYKALILEGSQLTPFHILNPYCYKVQESLPCTLKTTVAGAFSRILSPRKYFFQTFNRPVFEEVIIDEEPLLHCIAEAGVLLGPPETRRFTMSLETVRVWRTEAPRGKLISSIVQRELALSPSAIIYVIFSDKKIAEMCENSIRNSPVLTLGKSENLFVVETKNKLLYEAETCDINSSETPVPDKYLSLITGESLLLPIPQWNSVCKKYEIHNFFIPYTQALREKDYRILQYRKIELRDSIPGYKILNCNFLQNIAKTI